MSVPLRMVSLNTDPTQVQPVVRRKRTVSRPLRRLAGVGVISGTLLVLCLAAVGAMTIINGMGAGGDLKLISTPSDSHMSAVIGSVNRSGGYFTVTGTVCNVNAAKASNVEAVVELVDHQNRTIRMAEAVVAFSELHAGDTSPFSVVVPEELNAAGYRLSFRHIDGTSIQ